MKMKKGKARLPLNNSLTGKKCIEKTLEIVENTRGKPSITAFSTHLACGDGGGRPCSFD
jgi:hypothetical protein